VNSGLNAARISSGFSPVIHSSPARISRATNSSLLIPATVDDLLAFARMLLRGGDPVLAADQVREMSRDHLTAE
jgi:hypothetical protein